MEVAITKLAIACFFIIGVSHIAQPRAWAQFFINMHSRGNAGSLQLALLHFPLGVLIIAFHNVWHGWPIILTLIGWGLVLKSFLYFVFPKHGLKMLARVSLEKSWQFVVAGLFSLALSVFLAMLLLWRPTA